MKEAKLVGYIAVGIIVGYLGISIIDEVRTRYWVDRVSQSFNTLNDGTTNTTTDIFQKRIDRLIRENNNLKNQLKEMNSIKAENRRILNKYEFVEELGKRKAEIEWAK